MFRKWEETTKWVGFRGKHFKGKMTFANPAHSLTDPFGQEQKLGALRSCLQEDRRLGWRNVEATAKFFISLHFYSSYQTPGTVPASYAY